MLRPLAWLAAPATGSRMLALAPVDVAIIVLYFATVLGIGFYLKRLAKPARISSSQDAK